jgi:hypothetical protein
MSKSHLYSIGERYFYIRNFRNSVLGVIKWSLLSLGVASIFLSLTLIAGASTRSWAQCGVDSFVECQGGVTCASTDQVGCTCYDKVGHVVERHSCREAAREEDESFAPVEENVN